MEGLLRILKSEEGSHPSDDEAINARRQMVGVDCEVYVLKSILKEVTAG